MLPRRIKPGATIGIYSPSEPITETRRPRIAKGESILQQMGFSVRLAPNALARSAFRAGSVAERIQDLQVLLEDAQVDALLSAWGGKSCNELVGNIDFNLAARTRKPILGFSDAGVLLNHITARTGLVTFYGPNVLGKLDETEHADLRPLMGLSLEYALQNPPTMAATIKSGQATGRLIGGNLSTFVLGVACAALPAAYFQDSILFFEDMSTPQLLTQYLTALRNGGHLGMVRGVLIGAVISEENKDWKIVDPVDNLREFFADLSVPTLYAPIFGHAALPNPMIPIGARAMLDADACQLKLLEPIVE